ncbi:hypothetical protein [Methylobacterium isbiliense]|jgi:hypothetical protein|uniref:Uncharacterized protein n=1 Tax=Methylobacterium isbiliense TaxID=315478 RepID=A0ABQ4S6Y5_9HYPH|nr:hypothetical protein [Methylobacterium isbiliense]MDN3623163.1 hypothetical protein [Methylobacterium isbiliense]GJD98233.1 hypothetical protein GMJLKIPL_0140 [Methylobacterium isbiliense]
MADSTHRTDPRGDGWQGPRFVVGQDRDGRWLAVEIHGLGGGIFRSRADALHYAAAETGRRPDAVRLATEPVALGA